MTMRQIDGLLKVISKRSRAEAEFEAVLHDKKLKSAPAEPEDVVITKEQEAFLDKAMLEAQKRKKAEMSNGR